MTGVLEISRVYYLTSGGDRERDKKLEREVKSSLGGSVVEVVGKEKIVIIVWEAGVVKQRQEKGEVQQCPRTTALHVIKPHQRYTEGGGGENLISQQMQNP